MTNYPTYKLGGIAKIYNGNSINAEEKEKKYKGVDGRNYIGTKDIEFDCSVNYSNGVRIPFDEKKFRIAPKGSVLVCAEGGSAGKKSAFITEDVCFGNKLFAITNNQGLFDGKYVFYYTRYKRFFDLFKNELSGLIGGVSSKKFGEIPIPLPPLATQQAIVARIESLFAELDKAVQHLRTAQQQLKTYRQAVLNETMNATKFVPVGEVITEMGQGWSPKCCNEPSTSENEWGVIKTTAIQSCCFIEEENKKLPENLEPRLKHELKAGDILITRAGPKVRVGVCCLIKKTRPKLINCDKAYRVVLNRDMIDAQYFEYVINSPTCIKKLDELKTGISDSGVNLTQSRFYDLQIPLPPLAKQQHIVKEIESRLSQATASETYIENALQQAEALRQSILKKAFAGSWCEEVLFD